MANGVNVLQVLIKLAELSSGDGFTVYVNLDLLPAINQYELEEAQRRAGRKIHTLLAPTQELAEKIVDSCWETDVFFKDPKRGIGVKTEKLLSEKQEVMVRELIEKINSLETYISNP